MPLTCFQWHPDARAFAGTAEVLTTHGTATSHIPATPSAGALEMLRATLDVNLPFCVSDTPSPALDQLAPTMFATLTGGTSGAPKVIARTQESWIASFHRNAAQFGYVATDSIAVLGALSHSLALYGLLEGLHLGMNIHTLSALNSSSQCLALHRSACTILYATPTQLRLLPASTPLHHIRLILCGGGALTHETRNHIHTICPNAFLHVFYGAAETSFVTLSDSKTPEGSVGRAYPQVEISVRDADAAGVGTIWVKSPYLFENYLGGSSDHTRRDGAWLTVGELGYIDAQGYLFLRGRAGRVFNVADKTVYPEELEAQFAAHLGVHHCVVLAHHDTLRGHHIGVVLAGPEDGSLRQSLMTYCTANKITPPRKITFLDPFPTLPSGKPDLTRIAALTGCVL